MASEDEFTTDLSITTRPVRRKHWGAVLGVVAVIAGGAVIGPQLFSPSSPASAQTPQEIDNSVVCTTSLSASATGMKDAETPIEVTVDPGTLVCNKGGAGDVTIVKGSYTMPEKAKGTGNCGSFDITDLKLDIKWTMTDKKVRTSTITVGEISRKDKGTPIFDKISITGELAGASILPLPDAATLAKVESDVKKQCGADKSDLVELGGNLEIHFTPELKA